MGTVKVIEASRTVYLNGEIDDETSVAVCLSLLQMEADAPSERITLMINSPGGIVFAGWAIVDTVLLLGHVETVAVGLCASMAALVLMAGEPGHRSALPHSRILIHQPLGALNLQQTTDLEIQMRDVVRRKQELYDFIVQMTGKTYEIVEADCDRNHWLTAQEAVEYGIIDYIETPQMQTRYFDLNGIINKRRKEEKHK